MFGTFALRPVWIVSAFAASPLFADCNDLESRMKAMAERGDADGSIRLFSQGETDPGCSSGSLASLGRWTAYAHLSAARSPRVDTETAEQLLDQALQYGRPWQVTASLAEIKLAKKDYSSAVHLFQEAIDDIEVASVAEAPSIEVIRKIFADATIARSLAPDYIVATRARGEVGGLGRLSIRGHGVRRRAIPVRFTYNSAELEDFGIEAAEDMLTTLERQGSPNITLIGHTDPQGPDAYNLSLSLKRAEAVRDFLIKRGYLGDVQTDGRGEQVTVALDDPDLYSIDEIHQLRRRVELVIDN